MRGCFRTKNIIIVTKNIKNPYHEGQIGSSILNCTQFLATQMGSQEIMSNLRH